MTEKCKYFGVKPYQRFFLRNANSGAVLHSIYWFDKYGLRKQDINPDGTLGEFCDRAHDELGALCFGELVVDRVDIEKLGQNSNTAP